MGLVSRGTQPPRLHMSKEGLQGEANNPECLGLVRSSLVARRARPWRLHSCAFLLTESSLPSWSARAAPQSSRRVCRVLTCLLNRRGSTRDGS